jgi:uncharacterized protein with FMN-binding domain
MKNRKTQNSFVRAVKKLFLYAFVLVTFAAYAMESRVSGGPVAQTGGATAVPTVVVTPPGDTVIATPTETPAAAAGNPPDTGAANAANPTPTAPPVSAVRNPGSRAANTVAPTAAPTATSTPTAAPANASTGGYKDGTYTGPVVDVNWGYVQVQATVKSGKVSAVQFLQYPADRRTSQRINSVAVPALQQEAIQAQSANVNLITGATLTSEGFQQSLDAALGQAQG